MEATEADKHQTRFRFDKSINIGSIISAIVLFYTLYTGVEAILQGQREMKSEVSIMWSHFLREHKDITTEEYQELNQNYLSGTPLFAGASKKEGK